MRWKTVAEATVDSKSITMMVRRQGDAVYVFASSMDKTPVKAGV